MQSDEYRKMHALEEDFWWYRGMRRITAAVLNLNAGSPDDLEILDAGCGTGNMLQEFSRCTLKPPVGFDFSAEAVRFLRIRGLTRVLQASVTQIPFGDGTFDLVTCFDVLCQLPEDGDAQALREFRRVLKPAGKLFVRLPAYQWLYANHDRCSQTVRRYTRSRLAASLVQAGFVIRKLSYANFFLFAVLAAKRLVLERLGILADSSDLRPVPKLMNALLEIPLDIESRLLRRPGFRFPFGLSLICLAEKK
jgi:SAM-dependent methyltransferase